MKRRNGRMLLQELRVNIPADRIFRGYQMINEHQQPNKFSELTKAPPQAIKKKYLCISHKSKR